MSMINAALIDSFDNPPHIRSVPAPVAHAGQEVVQVLAVGISRATRGIAAGKHYMSPKSLPALAGIDAVVVRPNGKLAARRTEVPVCKGKFVSSALIHADDADL